MLQKHTSNYDYLYQKQLQLRTYRAPGQPERTDYTYSILIAQYSNDIKYETNEASV